MSVPGQLGVMLGIFIMFIPKGVVFSFLAVSGWPSQWVAVQERGWRTGLKPLNVVQPEGPSFTVDGNMVFWQKWSMRVSFNYSEGLVLHTVGSVSAAPCTRSTSASQVVLLGDCCVEKAANKLFLQPLSAQQFPSNISDSIDWMLSLALDDSAQCIRQHMCIALASAAKLATSADQAQSDAPECQLSATSYVLPLLTPAQDLT